MISSTDIEVASTKSKCCSMPSVEVFDQRRPLLSRYDLNKVIMNYLVTEGYVEASKLFRAETGIDLHVPLDLPENRARIRETIEKGHIEDTISLLNNLYPDLLMTFTDLHFELQKQHLVELIKSQNIEEALDYAQTQLAVHGLQNPDTLSELECVMSLLAFDSPEISPHADLLLESQRVKLASKVNAAILALHNQDSKTNLSEFYKLLLWAQHELEQKNVQYDRMTDIASGTLDSTQLMDMDKL